MPRSANASNLQQRSGTVSDINSHIFNVNLNTASQPIKSHFDDSRRTSLDAGTSQATPNVYQKIMLALSLSMIHALSKEKQFLQIGVSHCLDTRTVGIGTFDFLESPPLSKGSSRIACDARWLPNGSLQCIISQSVVTKLYTLTDALSKNLGPSLRIGDLIILSPSGLVGQYHGLEKALKDHSSYRSIVNLKGRTIAHLNRVGMSIPQNSKWICVLLSDADRDENNEMISTETNTEMSLWPAHLCLCKASDHMTEECKDDPPLDPNQTASDPLERAEAWFLGRSARTKAIETRRQEEIAEAERARAVERVDEENVVVDHDLQISQQATPRDVSGIYPTPPDGIPSTTHDMSASHNPQSSETNDEVIAVTMGEGIAQVYAENSNDGLFEEMDIDMFATNGLTEDDFNFFDDANASGRNDQAFHGEHLMLDEPVEATTGLSPLAEFSSPILPQSHDGGMSPLTKIEGQDDIHRILGNPKVPRTLVTAR